jgi:hypothetical protein
LGFDTNFMMLNKLTQLFSDCRIKMKYPTTVGHSAFKGSVDVPFPSVGAYSQTHLMHSVCSIPSDPFSEEREEKKICEFCDLVTYEKAPRKGDKSIAVVERVI